LNEIEREKIRDYLLGALDEERQRSFEELLVTDASVFDELLIVEDELTDQYLANELPESEHENFERRFLCAPERLRKLRFARVFRSYVTNVAETETEAADEPSFAPSGDQIIPRPKERSFFSFFPIQKPIVAYSLAAAVIFTLVGISWLVLTNLTTAPQQPGNSLLVELTPGLTRGSGEGKSIRIPPGTDSAQLQLALSSERHQTYRAEVLSSDRTSVLVKEALKPETIAGKKVINVTVPARLLKRDDYRVKLSGSLPNGSYEDIDSYTFRVIE